jgi:hypothetical protein
MRDVVDPSALVGDDTPDGFIERWEEIEYRGHPLGPAQYDGERYQDTDGDHGGNDGR